MAFAWAQGSPDAEGSDRHAGSACTFPESCPEPPPGTRIMILGGPGSGKSTLARQLGDQLGLPVWHMDQIHWMPGWTERPMDARRTLALEIESREGWIFEGSLGVTNAHRLSRASSVIWLDLPLPLRLWRVLRRSYLTRGRQRPDLPPDCPERFGIETLRFLIYVIRSNRSYRRRMRALLALRPEVPLWHLTRPHQVAALRAELRQPPPQTGAEPPRL